LPEAVVYILKKVQSPPKEKAPEALRFIPIKKKKKTRSNFHSKKPYFIYKG